jgi:hypothetical protein
MPDVRLAWLLLALTAAVVATAHVARIRPASVRDWRLVWVTFVFLMWLLAGFLSVRG